MYKAPPPEVSSEEFYETEGYEDEHPPAPFATREEWLREYGDPGDTADDGAWLHDPAGAGPRLVLLRVPEPKPGVPARPP
jgi:hypothetical protein